MNTIWVLVVLVHGLSQPVLGGTFDGLEACQTAQLSMIKSPVVDGANCTYIEVLK